MTQKFFVLVIVCILSIWVLVYTHPEGYPNGDALVAEYVSRAFQGKGYDITERSFAVSPPVLNVRLLPTISAEMVRQLKSGVVVTVDLPINTKSADGYVWVQIDELGWAALGSQNGEHVFLKPLGGGANLFSALPINIDKVEWVHPFGDTHNARNYGEEHGYNRYSQGKHGGIDFGTGDKVVGVYVATRGRVTRKSTQHSGVLVVIEVPPFDIYYNHLMDVPHSIIPGAIVESDTYLGSINTEHIGNEHLHLEIRYKKTTLVNPASMLPPMEWHNINWRDYPPDAAERDPRVQSPIEIGEKDNESY